LLTPKRELRLGKPREGCRAVAAKRRRRTLQIARSIQVPAGAENARFAVRQNARPEIWRVSAGNEIASVRGMTPKRFVYVLKTRESIPRYYVGVTSNVEQRLDWHNHGHCTHTTKYRPWQSHVVRGVLGRGARHALRAVLEIRIRPRVRQTPFRLTDSRSPCRSAVAAPAFAHTCYFLILTRADGRRIQEENRHHIPCGGRHERATGPATRILDRVSGSSMRMRRDNLRDDSS